MCTFVFRLKLVVPSGVDVVDIVPKVYSPQRSRVRNFYGEIPKFL